MFRSFVAVLAVLTCAACAPRFRTFYTHSPPDDDKGKSCVFQCENTKLQCEMLEDTKEQNCEMREQMDYDKCRSNPKNYCYKKSCGNDKERCDSQYDSCFQVCGGKITSETRCVANCDK